MTVGLITYHASHNYGSMLQTYALQTLLETYNFEPTVINLRLPQQKAFYNTCYNSNAIGLKNFVRKILYLPYKKDMLNQYKIFETFLRTNFNLTREEYISEKELSTSDLNFDYWICGSDQIWNLECLDFDWSYFLSFVKSGKKIAYAPSFGPCMNDSITRECEKIKKMVSSLDAISVREKGSMDIVYSLTGIKPSLVADPTWLLPVLKWNKCAGDKPIVDGDYIFLYVPRYVKETYKIASLLSKKLNMKVVVSNLVNWKVIYDSFQKELNTGPFEFLNLIRNASLVCSGSFHAVVFAILFNTPFWVVNGDLDNRISNILDLFGFQDRSISLDIFDKKVGKSMEMDFSAIDEILEKYKKISLDYLLKALDK